MYALHFDNFISFLLANFSLGCGITACRAGDKFFIILSMSWFCEKILTLL